ncbi:hypothetical protein DSUL_50360 [Desulfovibrionales bacterium]
MVSWGGHVLNLSGHRFRRGHQCEILGLIESLEYRQAGLV